MLTTVPALLPLLERLLELSTSIAKHIPKAIRKEVRFQVIECLEYLLHTTRMVIVRWEDLIGLMYRDTSLNAIQYAYRTLPIFINWEKNEHLEMLDNVLLLIFHTVKNKQYPPPIRKLNYSLFNLTIYLIKLTTTLYVYRKDLKLARISWKTSHI